MHRFRYITLLAALASLALVVVPAYADHFEPGSSKTCDPLIAGPVECTLTIAISDDFGPGVLEGDDIIVTLDAGITGATFTSASATGCVGGAAVSVDSPTQLSIDPAVSPAQGCTIVVTETLNATASGEVCQTLDNAENDPPVTVCADILLPRGRRGRLQEGRLGGLGRLQEPGRLRRVHRYSREERAWPERPRRPVGTSNPTSRNERARSGGPSPFIGAPNVERAG